MKSLIVKSLNQIQPQVINRNNNEFSVKTIIPDDEAGKCRVNFIEVEPGNYAYGYHYHEANEEVFYIISGTGIVRTLKEEITLKAGDVIAFPTGEEGAHVIRNGSETEKLVYIDFGTTIIPEIVHLPDFNQLMVISKNSMGIYDVK